MNAIFIYILWDPRNNNKCYIGQTVNLKERYHSHVYHNSKTHTKKTSWIVSLRKRNLKPVLEVLDEVSENEWRFWEMHYISLYKSWGFELMNSDNGGSGRDRGFKHKQETKDNQRNMFNSLYALGWKPQKEKHTEESKHLMSLARLGKEPWNKGLKSVVTWTQSSETKQHLHNISLTKILVFQIDIRTEKIIKDWSSMSLAAKTLGINQTSIANCCKGKVSHAGKYKWQFQDKELQNKYLKYIHGGSEPILQFDLQNNLIAEFPSIKKAREKYLKADISSCLSKRQKTAAGYIWKYKLKKED